jgi:hypothetical protein
MSQKLLSFVLFGLLFGCNEEQTIKVRMQLKLGNKAPAGITYVILILKTNYDT